MLMRVTLQLFNTYETKYICGFVSHLLATISPLKNIYTTVLFYIGVSEWYYSFLIEFFNIITF